MELKDAIAELRKQEKAKFDQTIDLIVNLKGIDLKNNSISTVVLLPNKVKDKKICGFLVKKSELVPTITQPDFAKYKDKKALKNLVKQYDFFMASAPLMPQVASFFGKVLGPSGKMPSPQLGVIMQENDNNIRELMKKMESAIKIRVKEASVKMAVAKEGMKDEQLIQNIKTAYEGLVNALPTKRENVKSVMIKTTMGKPLKVEIK